MTTRDRGILLTVALGGMLVPLNSTMIAVALPRIVDDLNTSLAAVSWLVTAYLIAMATLHPVAGKLGDRVGRRPLVLGGLLWFGVASVAAALAPSLEVLIAFRVQQAVAGALIFPNAIAVLREAVPAERLGGRLGLVNAALPLGAAAGPPLGGLLLTVMGWRAIFLVNLPLVLVPLALGVRALPRAVRRATAAFDFTGAALLCGVLSLVALTLTRGGDLPVSAAAAGGVAAALAVALLVVELRRSDPVVDPRLFGSPPFAAATAGVALNNMAMYVTLLAVPLLLVARGGWSSAAIGGALAVMFVASVLWAPIGGRMSDRAGRRLPALCGAAMAAAALLPLAIAPGDLPGVAVVVTLAVAGAGFGLSAGPLQAAAIEAAPLADAGSAAGVFATSRYVGSITGASLLAGPLAPAAVGVGGHGQVFAVLALAATGAALAAVGLPGARRQRLAAVAGTG